jgi:HK97 family phage portal protein
MTFLDRLFSRSKAATMPRVSVDGEEITLDLTSPELIEFMRGQRMSAAGVPITPETALKNAVAYRCTSLICGSIGSLPWNLKKITAKNKTADATDHPLWPLLKVAPNPWQTPQEFKKLMQMRVLMDGNGYALKVQSRGVTKQLIPLTGQMQVFQNDDFTLRYEYHSPRGMISQLTQDDVFHLRGPSLNGIVGVSMLTYAMESLGLGLTMDRHAGRLFRNRAAVGGKITSEKNLDETQRKDLRASLDEFRSSDGERTYKDLVLEGGIDYSPIGMSSVDAQFIQTKEMSAVDVCMFFGVPPYMVGLTTKTTSWGSGIEQMGIGFVAYTLQDHLTAWHETIRRDLQDPDDTKTYVAIDPAGLIKGDTKTLIWAYATGRQWGWWSADDIRAKMHENPLPDGQGEKYLQPLNMEDVADPPPDDPAPGSEGDNTDDNGDAGGDAGGTKKPAPAPKKGNGDGKGKNS